MISFYASLKLSLSLAVIWENLGFTSSSQLFHQKIICLCYLAVLNCTFAYVTWYTFVNYSTIATSIVISVIDDYAPELIRIVVDMTERHAERSDRQWSIMSQMFFFMVWNSATVIYVITPTTSTLSKDNIQQIIEIIFFGSLFSPVMRFLALDYRFKCRAHAPFARELA